MLICSAAMSFSCAALRAQESNREVRPVDLSVHSGVDEQRQEPPLESDPGHVKPPNPYTAWAPSQPKQPAETLSWRAGAVTSVPDKSDEEKSERLTKLPSLSEHPLSQHSMDHPKTAPAFQGLLPAPAAEPEAHDLFAPFDQKPFVSIGNTPFSNSGFHPPKDTILTVRGKSNPPKPKDGSQVALTRSSDESAKH
jgi:hypothetical protein